MGKTNREWHEAHKMPKNATEDQRIAWHTEHAKHCGCRKIEGGVAEMFRRRGLEVPVHFLGTPDDIREQG